MKHTYLAAFAVLLAFASAAMAVSVYGDFHSGTGNVLRSSPNYLLADTLGQFVVGRSSACSAGTHPMDCPYSCAILEHGFWHSDIHIELVAEIKQHEDYDYIYAYAKIVTAGSDQLSATFFIEDQDRTAGMRVNLGPNPLVVSEGDMVDVSGVIKSGSAERYIDYPMITVRFPRAMYLGPFFMANKWLGGQDIDTLVPAGSGLNNTCLLVRTSGRVTYVDTSEAPGFFYIDDGSGCFDGSYQGIRVICDDVVGDPLGAPDEETYVVVTGISSTAVVDSHVVRAIRPRTQSDILEVQ